MNKDMKLVPKIEIEEVAGRGAMVFPGKRSRINDAAARERAKAAFLSMINYADSVLACTMLDAASPDQDGVLGIEEDGFNRLWDSVLDDRFHEEAFSCLTSFLVVARSITYGKERAPLGSPMTDIAVTFVLTGLYAIAMEAGISQESWTRLVFAAEVEKYQTVTEQWIGFSNGQTEHEAIFHSPI